MVVEPRSLTSWNLYLYAKAKSVMPQKVQYYFFHVISELIFGYPFYFSNSSNFMWIAYVRQVFTGLTVSNSFSNDVSVFPQGYLKTSHDHQLKLLMSFTHLIVYFQNLKLEIFSTSEEWYSFKHTFWLWYISTWSSDMLGNLSYNYLLTPYCLQFLKIV